VRDYKFRGKRVDNGEWVYFNQYGAYVDKNGNEISPKRFTRDCGYKIIPETVGQFTGLHDKNGKEIYEGDICQFYRHSDISHMHEKTDIAQIYFFRGAFMYNTKYVNERTLSSLWRPGESVEVIGNIHSNPELLEVPHA
jgi:uncharacterized phage protein (TIGR01671 family)